MKTKIPNEKVIAKRLGEAKEKAYIVV